MKIAILGYGTVGSGVYEIISNGRNLHLQDLEVTKVFARSRDKMHLATNNIEEIIYDKNIDVVVECLGGISPAYEFICEALKNKKHVVTANKAVVAKHLEQFLALAEENNVKFLFEASVGGGVPWLYNVEKAKRIDNIEKIYGIFNGTSNFILDNMITFNKDFDDVLARAQELGYAEADPSADVDGFDVVNKLIISNALAFNNHFTENISTYSMRTITKTDIDYLKKQNLSIRYIGETNVENNKLESSAMLTIFDYLSQESAVPMNYNLISLVGETIGTLKFYGQGAGKLPTANAIVQDIIDIKTNVPREQIELANSLEQTDELTNKNYLIRCSYKIDNNLIEKVDTFSENYYHKTKKISLKQLNELVGRLDDSNIVVAKYFD